SLAGRWVLSQFAFGVDSSNNPLAPFYQCIAVSQTGDPAGSYNLYAFLWGNTLNDYAKLGVWSDGYYMSANQFNGNTFVGVGVAAFERSRMLTGAASPQMVYFNVGKTSQIYASLLPADLDGTTPPPAGAAEIFGEIDPGSTFNLWNFHVDWGSPAKSTFGQSLQPDQSLPVASYRQLPCVTASTPTTSCIPQPGSAPRLDGVADRLMNRLAFRSYGDHQSLAAVHTVWADGTDRAGLRWYELRSTGSGWSIYQQGTFAPADGLYRWMGSAAMDGQGDLAVGYSVSGASLYPSIRYAGRLAGDPLGSLAQGEAGITAGGGAQLSSSGRWGDYSDLTVDPRDGCTFWYTQEYYPSSSNDGWQTRIASFRFTACTPVGLPLGPKLVFLPLIDR
ncbi:MAG TPA: hypothetical protein VF813_07765, partial [Anaerolineaceae bacterium]